MGICYCFWYFVADQRINRLVIRVRLCYYTGDGKHESDMAVHIARNAEFMFEVA